MRRHDAERKSFASLDTRPVCGMEVADMETAPTAAYKGKTYYVCSEEDKAKFQKSPAQYVRKDS